MYRNNQEHQRKGKGKNFKLILTKIEIIKLNKKFLAMGDHLMRGYNQYL